MPPLPQFRGGSSVAFGPAPTPNVRASNVGELLSEMGRAGGEIEDALHRKEDEDGRVWAAKTQTELRAKYNQRLTEAQSNGEDLTGFVKRIEADLSTDLQNARKASPNRYGTKYLDIAAPDFTADVQGAAFGAEARYGVTKRITDTESIIESNRGQVFTNPKLFAKTYAETKGLVDGLSLPVEAKARLQQQLQGMGASAVQGMIENGDPYEAAKQLKAGAWNKYVDPDRLAALTNAAQGEIRRRESEAKAAASVQRQEMLFDVQMWAQANAQSIAETGQAVPPPFSDGELKAVLKPKQYEQIMHANARASMLYEATGDMRTQSPAEMQATVEKLKPKGGEADYNDRKSIYDAAVRVRNATLEARKSDPGAAAREAFPEVRNRWQFYEQNQHPAHLKDAIKASLAAQEAMGIPADRRAPMPHQMAIAVAGQLKSAKPEVAAKTLKEQAAAFGQYWPQAFRQMSKNLDPNTRVAAIIPDSREAALLIEGSRQAVGELRKAAGVKDGDDGISAAVATDDRMIDLTQSLSQRAGGSAAATNVAQAVERLALQRMRTYAEDQATATEAAIKSVIEDKYGFARVGSRPFRVPRDKVADPDTIETGARGFQEALKGADIDPPPDGADQRDSYADAVRRNGYWVTNDDESGAVLYNERGVPVTKGGKPIVKTWSELGRAADTAPWRAFEGFRE